MRIKSPLHVHWEITNVCNYNCQHCYQKNDEQRYILPFSDLLTIANKIAQANVFQVSVTGGEPFLVKGLSSILELLHSNNIDIIICSNGSKIQEKDITMLNKLEIPVQISLDSYVESKHNNFRQADHAFTDALTSINNMLHGGVEVSVAFCATQYNFNDLEGVIKLCISLGVKHLIIGEMIPVRGENNVNNELLFSKENYILFTECLIKYVDEYREKINIHVNSEWGFVFSDFYEHVPCTALDRDFAIMHNGFVSPCPFIRNPSYFIGNVLEQDIVEIWNKSRESLFYVNKNIGCSSKCKFYDNCLSGCKAQLANLNLGIDRRDIRCPI